MANAPTWPKRHYRGCLTDLNPVIPRATRQRLERRDADNGNNVRRRRANNVGVQNNDNIRNPEEGNAEVNRRLNSPDRAEREEFVPGNHEPVVEQFECPAGGCGNDLPVNNPAGTDVENRTSPDLSHENNRRLSTSSGPDADTNDSSSQSGTENEEDDYEGFHPKFFPDLQVRLKDQLSTTKFEAMLMILSFSLRHGLSSVAMEDLCKLLNTLLEDEVVNTSEYWFKQVFGSNLPYKVHLYCKDCEAYLGDVQSIGVRVTDLPCPVCSKICTVHNLNNGSFFLTLCMKSQLKDFLETTPDILELLNYRWERPISNNIRDVYDSEMYKTLCEEGKFLSHKYILSATISTDGASVFFSTHNTAWPCMMRLNELPPQRRFSQNNYLLCAIWFGKRDPNMLVFMNPILKELKQLHHTGFKWTAPCGREINSKLIIFNYVVDSVAKPLVQCVKQFNGYWGCGYCYHPGCVLEEGSNHAKFIMGNDDMVMLNDLSFEYTVNQVDKLGQETVHHVKDRTNNEMRRDMETVQELRENNPKAEIKGVKGSSCFFIFNFFDMVFGFGIDWLHAVLLGVVKTVTNLWFDSNSKGQLYYLRKSRHLVNERLSALKLPLKLRRRDLDIEDRPHWKGNEWRTWLLYCSLPVSDGILPPAYLKHHAILVSAIFILLEDSITIEELDDATWMLGKYVEEFQTLYGQRNMHYNVHLLLHIGKCVKLMGPLWSFSLFSFESFNGSLVRLVKGTRGVMTQIAKKYSRFKNIQRAIRLYDVSPAALRFCSDLLSCRIVTLSLKVDGVTFLNSPISVPLTPEQSAAFNNEGLEVTNLTYERMIKDGVKYNSECYKRKGSKTADTLVKFKDNSYGEIQRIIVTAGNNNERISLELVQLVNIENNVYITRHPCGARSPHIKLCSPIVYGATVLIAIDQIYQKAIFIHTNTNTYVSDFPNVFKTD